jgi:hypothetical protein
MTNWFEHPLYLPDEVKTLDQAEAAYALREAWHRVYGHYPSDESLAVLWGKSALETGRWKHIHNYNFGNIKWKDADTCHLTMFTCGEEVSEGQALSLLKEDPEHIKIVRTYTANGNKRASIEVKAGHSWSRFRAFTTPSDGAEDYLKFVSQNKRYTKAWEKVIAGDPKGYAHELGVAGYYTAPEAQYTEGVVNLFNEFMKRKKELLSWKEAVSDTIPSPPPDPNEPEGDIHDTDKDLSPPIPILETKVSNPDPPANQQANGTTPLTAIIEGVGKLIAQILKLLKL